MVGEGIKGILLIIGLTILNGTPIWIFMFFMIVHLKSDWFQVACPSLFVPRWQRDKLDRAVQLCMEALPALPPFAANEAAFKSLQNGKDEEESLRILFAEAVNHVALSQEKIDFIIETQTDLSQSKWKSMAAGWYRQKNDRAEIAVVLTASTNAWQVTSTLYHEIAHHYADTHNLRVDSMYNEIITDVLAVCLGFGRYVCRGHMKQNVYEKGRKLTRGAHMGSTTRGYLSAAEIQYCRKQLKRLALGKSI